MLASMVNVQSGMKSMHPLSTRWSDLLLVSKTGFLTVPVTDDTVSYSVIALLENLIGMIIPVCAFMVAVRLITICL